METTIVIKATAERAPVETGVTITTQTRGATRQEQSASTVSAPAQTQAAEKEKTVITPASVKLGLDVHAAQITACRQLDGSLPQPAHRRSSAEVLALVAEHRTRGAQVYSCDEAGPCGYGLHRSLVALGAVNYVVAPQRWDLSGRRVKTDKRDARELCLRLDQYVRGNTAAFTVVRVPTPAQQQRRALCRQRGAVLKERQRCELRGHGLALAQGVRAPAGWWEPAAWAGFAPALPDWLRPLLARWQRHAVRFQDELDALTAAPRGAQRRAARAQRPGSSHGRGARQRDPRLGALHEPAATRQLHRLVSGRGLQRRAPATGRGLQAR